MPNFMTGSITASAPFSTLITTSYDTAVAANIQRVGLVLTNLSSSTMYIAFGDNAAVLRTGIALLPDGGAWVMDEFSYNKERITAIAHTASSILGAQEFVERS